MHTESPNRRGASGNESFNVSIVLVFSHVRITVLGRHSSMFVCLTLSNCAALASKLVCINILPTLTGRLVGCNVVSRATSRH